MDRAQQGTDASGALWGWIDHLRRCQGRALDLLGLGPVQTPSRVALKARGVTLKAYRSGRDKGAVLVLVPAPIKRPYIWDLLPEVSVVQQCLRAHTRPYLVQWERPGTAEQTFGLAEYADRLLGLCLDAVQAETKQRKVFLAGHSLGGTFAAIFAALHPGRVAGLVLLGAPLHFGPEAGALCALAQVAALANNRVGAPEEVAGSLLDVASYAAAPVTFGWARWLDWFNSLPDVEALRTHWLVERWTLDEMPLARQLFTEVADRLLREDRLMRGTLIVRGRRASPERVTAPLLTVADADCVIAPPESIQPFHRAARSREKRWLWYEGDTGVALRHVGMLVGRAAHRDLWPKILCWVERVEASKASCWGRRFHRQVDQADSPS
jgi:polyhydroxyalkanoate synthase